MTMENKLKVVVMTQGDRFFIPHNIRVASEVCELLEVVEVDCKSSLDNKLGDYLQWFGFMQCAKMGIKTVFRAFYGILDRICGYRLCGGECSVFDVSRSLGVAHRVINDSNAPDYVEHMREVAPDLIISYSAPQIIKPELMSVPKHGIINVHGSLLPDFRGCLPSFWYLYEKEKVGGATVHYMSEKIDDGAIIRQESVDISDCKTMFQLIARTKKLGGKLMAEAITDIARGSVRTIPNDTSKGRYFTWPTKEQAREFTRNGYRFV